MSESDSPSDWPRLSATLTGPRSPLHCQSCGQMGSRDLLRWQEHDQADGPEPIVVVLCPACSDRLIEPHPRPEEALAAEVLSFGHDVVIDRTHLTRESRERWIRFAMIHNVSITAVTFPIELPEIHAHRRFATDARGRPLSEWLAAACHHAEQARREPLSQDEGFDEILTIEGEVGLAEAEA